MKNLPIKDLKIDGGTQPRSEIVAAAAVDIINIRRGGKKLPSWWKSQEVA